MIQLDTHVVAWLAGGLERKVPDALRRRFAHEPPTISPVVALELDLLYEIGRIRAPSRAILDHLEATLGLTLAPVAFASAVAAARGLTWTRDPFDRLVVGSALAQGAELATVDATIRAHYPLATWD